MIKIINGWKLKEKVINKENNYRKFSDGKNNTIDIWRSATKHWNVTMNGSFLTRKDTQGNATKHANLFMKNHKGVY